jgi:hypothetical protein
MIHGAGSPPININERGRWGGDEEARLVNAASCAGRT